MLNVIIVLAAVNFVELACICLCIALLRESYLKIKDASALLPVNLNTTERLPANWVEEEYGSVSQGIIGDDMVAYEKIGEDNFYISNLKER